MRIPVGLQHRKYALQMATMALASALDLGGLEGAGHVFDIGTFGKLNHHSIEAGLDIKTHHLGLLTMVVEV